MKKELNKNEVKLKEYKARAKELVGKMTLEEKCLQMLHSAPAIERLGIKGYNWWNEALHGVARAGVATVFPRPLDWQQVLMKNSLKVLGMPLQQKEGLNSIFNKNLMTQISIKV